MNFLIFFVLLTSTISLIKDSMEMDNIIKKLNVIFNIFIVLSTIIPIIKSIIKFISNPLGYTILWYFQTYDIVMDVDTF
jgi:predicted KAP-like P-loop ATPase